MNPIFVALLLLPLAQGPAGGGAAQPGKVMWEAFENDCKLCHGVQGEGGLGPDLAGHSLTPAQFLRAVRKPWGIMPAFVADKNLTDQQVGQIATYLASLPKVAEPSSTWFTTIPALATPNQRLMISMGCGQCHGQTMANPRRTAGGAGADYAWFKKEVYEHTSAPGHVNSTHLRMGNYSPMRVPEPVLQQLWQFFAFEQGLRAPVNAAVSAGVPSAKGVTYTLTVSNTGTVGKGSCEGAATSSSGTRRATVQEYFNNSFRDVAPAITLRTPTPRHGKFLTFPQALRGRTRLRFPDPAKHQEFPVDMRPGDFQSLAVAVWIRPPCPCHALYHLAKNCGDAPRIPFEIRGASLQFIGG